MPKLFTFGYDLVGWFRSAVRFVAGMAVTASVFVASIAGVVIGFCLTCLDGLLRLVRLRD